MLKQLQTVCMLTLLASMSLLPMEKEDEFAQAREFHERLQRASYGILQDGAWSYYKKIDPIISNRRSRVNHWMVSKVSVEKKKLKIGSTGYHHSSEYPYASFYFNPSPDFDPNIPFNILVRHHGEHNVQFTKFNEKKVTSGFRFDIYNELVNALHENRLSSHYYVTLKGIMSIAGKNKIILIECLNLRDEPIILQGMEIVCCYKDEKKTKIFFDFIDDTNKPVDPYSPVEYRHLRINMDLKRPYTKNYKHHEKEIYELFAWSPTRSDWILDDSNFYDCDHKILTSLPYSYSDSKDYIKEPKKQMACVFNDVNNLFYQVPDEIWELIFLAQNKYSIINPNMLATWKAVIQWCAMKNIINISLICKRFNKLSQKLLLSYTKEITGYINELGGKDQAACHAFIYYNGSESFRVTEICKAMKADLNVTKYTDGLGQTLLTRAIENHDGYKVERLLQGGADPKHRNEKGDIPIDLAYANGLLAIAHLIKDHGGDPEDKYEYKNDTFVCKQGQGGQAYTPQQVNGLNAANNNPPPIPPQTFSLASWLSRSPSYLFLAGISAGAVAYWLYTKYRAVDEDNVEEDDYLEANAESEDDCLNKVSACTVSQ